MCWPQHRYIFECYYVTTMTTTTTAYDDNYYRNNNITMHETWFLFVDKNALRK